jgi:diazepam-binding inhibitor (GABA receptor modulating acyl-CoA-binding protein)
MSDTEAAFTIAVEDVEQLSERPGNEDLLRLYALYKQATVGDVSGKRPGMMEFVKRAKYDAWAILEGMSQEDAMQAYVELVAELKAR